MMAPVEDETVVAYFISSLSWPTIHVNLFPWRFHVHCQLHVGSVHLELKGQFTVHSATWGVELNLGNVLDLDS